MVLQCRELAFCLSSAKRGPKSLWRVPSVQNQCNWLPTDSQNLTETVGVFSAQLPSIRVSHPAPLPHTGELLLPLPFWLCVSVPDPHLPCVQGEWMKPHTWIQVRIFCCAFADEKTEATSVERVKSRVEPRPDAKAASSPVPHQLPPPFPLAVLSSQEPKTPAIC